MVKKSEDHKRAFILLEIGFVALLGWIVLTSDAGKTVQAGNMTARRVDPTAQKQRKSQDRSVPPEGIPEEASPRLLAQVGTPVACQGFDFANGDPQGFTV